MEEFDSYIYNIHAMPVSITALVILILGLSVFYRERASFVGWLYLLHTIPIFFWFCGMVMVYSSSSPELAIYWAKYTAASVIVLPASFYTLSVVILNEYAKYKLYVTINWVISVLLIFLMSNSDSYITGVHDYPWGYYVSHGELSHLFLLYFTVVIARTLYMYWRSYRTSPEGSIVKKRSKLLLVGFMIGTIAAVDFLPAYGFEIYPIGFVFVTLLFLYTTYVIWHHKLVDITPEFASGMILETMSESVLVVDTDNIVRIVNDSATKLFSTVKTNILNHRAESVISQIKFSQLNELIEQQDELKDYRTRYLTNNNVEKHLEVSGHRLLNKGKEVIGYLYAINDITKQYEAEQILKNSKKQLEQLVQERTAELVLAKEAAEASSAAKTRFLSVMSHELRTPLTTMLGYSDLLEDDEDVLTETHQHYVGMIKKSGSHLLDLISDVLDMARIESGNLEINFESINLYEIVSSLTEEINVGFARLGNTRIQNNISDTGIMLQADNKRLRQVLFNILGNAVKYSSEGGVVYINSKMLDNGFIQISVTDTGIGIREEDIELAFEPFERLEQGNGTIQGSGVGLTVTKQLTEAMNGRIGVESTYGEGSTFWIELPVNLNNSAIRESSIL